MYVCTHVCVWTYGVRILLILLNLYLGESIISEAEDLAHKRGGE
jgi:hypothetical protein